MNVLEDTGLDLDEITATAHRAFHLAMGQDPDGEIHPAWEAVARHVIAMAESDGDDVQLSFTQVGSLLRREYIRASDGDGIDFDGLPGWEALTRQHQLAWIAVARHLFNVMSGDPEITRRLNQHEAMIADWAKAQLPAAG